ncbi:MAG: GNAT family N-acetyltransferase [Myxococcaceae bacterium]|nr:GNAT family N-acetyltransferase [Myxococcaceae bacterium]
MTLEVRALSSSEVPLVEAFWRAAPEYWLLAEGACDASRKAHEFFTDAPPGADVERSHRLGLMLDGQLSGLAELAFGFPSPPEAFLGLLVLGRWAQGRGHGRRLLAHVEALARAAGSTTLFLAVLDANPRGRAFWEREGFRTTGVRRFDATHGQWLERLGKPL